MAQLRKLRGLTMKTERNFGSTVLTVALVSANRGTAGKPDDEVLALHRDHGLHYTVPDLTGQLILPQ